MFFLKLFSSKRRQPLPHRPPAAQSTEPGTPMDEVGRHGRRDALFDVVRESMIKAGALSSQFKFKVLTLNGAGTRFMVMLTLPHMGPDDLRRLHGVELDITRLALLKHGVEVEGVYWRSTEVVTRPRASAMPAASQPSPQSKPPTSMPAMLANRRSHAGGRHRLDPVLDEEVAAFRKALATPALPGGQLVDSGQILNSHANLDFADTDVLALGTAPAYDNHLSCTQYAGL